MQNNVLPYHNANVYVRGSLDSSIYIYFLISINNLVDLFLFLSVCLCEYVDLRN